MSIRFAGCILPTGPEECRFSDLSRRSIVLVDEPPMDIVTKEFQRTSTYARSESTSLGRCVVVTLALCRAKDLLNAMT